MRDFHASDVGCEGISRFDFVGLELMRQGVSRDTEEVSGFLLGSRDCDRLGEQLPGHTIKDTMEIVAVAKCVRLARPAHTTLS